MKKIIIIFAAAFLLSACTSMKGTFGVISSKPIDFKKSHIEKIQGFEFSQDGDSIFLIIPTGDFSDEKTVEKALQKLEQRYPNISFVKDVSVQVDFFYIPLIYGKKWITLKGDIWETLPNQ